MSKSSADSFKQAIDNLTAARDEARLGLHLLSMEGKQKWEELEVRARELELRLGEQAEKATEASAARAEELAHAVRKFVDSHLRK